jgi:ketosteroid isomerase-like protein
MKNVVRTLAAFAFLSACAPNPTEVVKQLNASFEAKDLNALLATLSDDVTVAMGPETLKGKEAVKASFEKVLKEAGKSELVGEYKVEGDTVTWTEKVAGAEWEKLGLESLEANERATVIDGKIATLTWNLTAESLQKLSAAQTAQLQKVAVAFDEAVNAKNLDAALALVADDVVMSLDKNYSGKEQLAAGLKAMFEQNTKVVADARTVEGNKLSWTAKVENDEFAKAKLGALEGKVVAVVENGKLKSLVNTWTPDAQKKLESLTATAEAPQAKPAKGKKK